MEKEELYECMEKIIRYSCEVSRKDFNLYFMNFDLLREEFDVYSAESLSHDYDDVDEYNDMKHNILKFWISLTTKKKKKLIEIINKYWENNNYKEFIKIEYVRKKYDKYNETEYLKCEDKGLKNIDLLCHENMKLIICNNNKITKLDDLPIGLEELYCEYNEIKSFNNLPKGLKILCCRYNDINEIEIKKVSTKIKISNIVKFKLNEKEVTESVSEINGTMIPMYYELITKNKIHVLDILKELTKIEKKEENIFGMDIEFVKNIDVNNLKINDVLKLANYFNCFQTKYLHKTKQIKHYNWIDENDLNKCVKRIDKIIKKKSRTNVNYEIEVHKNNYIEYKKLTGFIDCIDGNNIYEFKFVDEIKDEHKIQLCTYIYLYCLNNGIDSDEKLKQYNFFLFNIKNNNLIKFETTYENICEMYDKIIEYKLNGWIKKTDEEFINQCIINKKTIKIKFI